MQKKAIFLDRDGVINKEKNYLYKKEDFEFIDGVFEACRYFQEMGYQLVVVTNQSGISRGYYQEAIIKRLLSRGYYQEAIIKKKIFIRLLNGC